MIFNSKKNKEKEQNLQAELEKNERKIESLEKELALKTAEISALKEKTNAIELEKENIISSANEKAQDILSQATKRYNEELLRLKIFVERWIASLPEPKERTPESRKRAALATLLSEILKDKSCVQTIDEGVELLQKLNDAISGGSEQAGGFNLEEVLNPSSELDLATLCKELGVMD